MTRQPHLLLASASMSRRAMLEAAGVPLAVLPAHVDEDAVKAGLAADGAPVPAIADRLAELKALKVSARQPGAIVLGADSMLALDARRFLDKPGTREALRVQLRTLRGRAHQLVSAAVLAVDGRPVWRHTDSARLSMRAFSDAFLDHYVATCGDAVAHSVGGYHLEGLGAQLFDRIDGDHFTVRGLPLLPLLAQLRVMGVLAA